MSVAEKLKSIISSKGVSYTFISAKTGMPVDTLSKIFLGKRRLLASELIAICDALEISLTAIYNHERKE